MKNKQSPSLFRRALKWVLWVFILQFVFLNISAAIYAYRLTRLLDDSLRPQEVNEQPNFFQKTWRIFRGPDFYKARFAPDSSSLQYKNFELFTKHKLSIKGWWRPMDQPKGTVLLFHGLMGNRTSCQSSADAFYAMGYQVMMIDFRGHGQSNGRFTDYGYSETEEVKLLYDYAVQQGAKNIFLWGISMGGSTIIKAMHDYPMNVSGIIADAPFASLQHHLEGRAPTFGFPKQPFAFLVTGWIGLQRGFNGYGYKLTKYAKDITCPVLLQCGDKDHLVSQSEFKKLFDNIASTKKKSVIYEGLDHVFLVEKDPATWKREVREFLSNYSTAERELGISN